MYTYWIAGTVWRKEKDPHRPCTIGTNIEAESFDDAYEKAKKLDWESISDIHVNQGSFHK